MASPVPDSALDTALGTASAPVPGPAPGAPILWQTARVLAVHDETPRAKTFRLELPHRTRHMAGQYFVLRLVAPDGYTASRAYSLSSPPEGPDGSTVIDLTDGKAWVAWEADGQSLDRQHGGPARLLVPHLYFWKSAKFVAGLRLVEHDEPGFWERNGYHDRGDPWLEQRYQGD